METKNIDFRKNPWEILKFFIANFYQLKILYFKNILKFINLF